jgi:hypothetical protein
MIGHVSGDTADHGCPDGIVMDGVQIVGREYKRPGNEGAPVCLEMKLDFRISGGVLQS